MGGGGGRAAARGVDYAPLCNQSTRKGKSCPFLGCTCPAQWCAGVRGEWLRERQAGRAAARGAKERQTRRACKRTAAQDQHAEEDELPVLGLYVPAVQLVQDGAPPVLNEPAAHGRHAEEDELPALGLKVPAAQGRHAVEEELPALGLYVPAAHAAQEAGVTA